ncbi:MAG: phosphopantetheine-binding protein [Bacteroidales bacterium]|nr:phosphopantetheine-binding protein [Bacteroidales bacterium]
MKNRIIELLSEALPAVDFESEFLFSELDSLGIATILLLLSNEYHISLNASDVTPKNFMTIDSLVAMVESKLNK